MLQMWEMGEGMKELKDLIQYRKYHPTLGWGDHEGGFFVVQSPLQKSQNMAVVASIGGGWDHVSVSLGNRCPTWREMDYIKRLFFKPDEVVIQIHPEEKKHINLCEFCLHLWRPQKQEIPLPPEWMVA